MLVAWRNNVFYPWCDLTPTPPHLGTNAAIFHRVKYSRNRQRFPYLRWSLHRVCPTLSTETPPDSWLGRWMAKHSWPSRGCIFYRIRISKHDLGSSLDRESQLAFTRSFWAQVNLGPPLHRMAISPLPPARWLAYSPLLWSSMVSSSVEFRQLLLPMFTVTSRTVYLPNTSPS